VGPPFFNRECRQKIGAVVFGPGLRLLNGMRLRLLAHFRVRLWIDDARGFAEELAADLAVWPRVMKTKTLTPIAAPLHRLLAAALALCGMAAVLGGCASEPESHVVSAPPPGAPVVTTTGQPAVYATPAPSTQSTIIVTQAPPALQQEVVSARPSSDHVWVGGYWTWRNSRYEWVSGHWTVPPRSGASWVPPRWEPEGGSYRFYEGYWD